jgi:ABC-2 type transport system ATP-binding protein
LLILDEPTAGLDPNQIREVRALIRGLKEEHTVLLSTHILAEVEMICDRAVVLHGGRVVAQGTLDELRQRRVRAEAELVLEPGEGVDLVRLEQEATKLVRVMRATKASDGVHWKVHLERTEEGLSPLVEWLVAARVKVREARLVQTRLEDVFATLTDSGDSTSEDDVREDESGDGDG